MFQLISTKIITCGVDQEGVLSTSEDGAKAEAEGIDGVKEMRKSERAVSVVGWRYVRRCQGLVVELCSGRCLYHCDFVRVF